MSSKASTTIGFERRFNRALPQGELEEFVAQSASVAAPKPPNVARIVGLNRGPFVAAPPDAPELPAPAEAAQLLDTRPVADFLAGHRAGAVNVPIGGSSFATKAGFVLDPERPVTVAARDADEARRAIRGLRSVGFLDVDGYVLGGGPEPMQPVGLDELQDLLDRGAELLDVREQDERDEGYIAGSRNIPYRLLAVCGADLPTDRTLVTICESGSRAAVAASVLAARGLDARPVVNGGIADWIADGKPAVSFRRCGSG
jgi:rhodanese-related sulfurtransferase